ncbi:Dabb family protein [Nitriliruptoraceae bacterium ZYF776]|nr:Dabb family protein [Profundirhabdus halotolerans]
MISHTVVFRFRDEVAGADRDDVLAEVARFPDHFPAMRRFRLGANRSTRDDRMSHGFFVEFDDEDALARYLASDRHERFVRERWRPVIADQAIVTIETPVPSVEPTPESEGTVRE